MTVKGGAGRRTGEGISDSKDMTEWRGKKGDEKGELMKECDSEGRWRKD